MTLNQQIWRWFDAGEIREALDSEGEFVLPDVTYRDQHDQLLVIDQLFDWAKARSRTSAAAEELQNAIERYASAGDVMRAARAILTYLIVQRDRGETIGVEPTMLARILAAGVERHPAAVVSDESTRKLVLAVAERIPELKRLLFLP
ncbi:MAG: hypothetical protein ACREMY_18550 [bacterium]